MAETLLSIRDLVVRYRRGMFAPAPAPAVDRVSLSVAAGRTLGVVGESGSGKSSLVRTILRLVPAESGSIRFDGDDWLALSARELRARRRKIGLVAQNPFLSLSPGLTVEQILAEPMKVEGVSSREERRERGARTLAQCGLPESYLGRRAHALSGGQAQRVAIARALVLSPKLLILDEPTAALDILVQAQILNLLQDLKARLGLSMLFVTHDLKVVQHMAEDLLVMHYGKAVEAGPTAQVTSMPQEDYTRALLAFGKSRIGGGR